MLTSSRAGLPVEPACAHTRETFLTPEIPTCAVSQSVRRGPGGAAGLDVGRRANPAMSTGSLEIWPYRAARTQALKPDLIATVDG